MKCQPYESSGPSASGHSAISLNLDLVPVADGIDLDEIIFGPKHVSIVAVGQEIMSLISLCQNRWISGTMCNDVHITWGNRSPGSNSFQYS